MTRRSLPFVPFLAISLVAAIGCDNCAEPLSELPVGDGPLPTGDGDAELELRVLQYVGDDPVTLYYGESRVLRFTRKTESGAPVAGDSIALSSTGDGVAGVNVTLPTDGAGAVEITVVAGGSAGDSVVVGRATDLDGSIDEDSVTIHVVEDPAADLRVSVESDARIEVESADIRVFLGDNLHTCAQVLAGPEPLAQASATLQPLPASQTFAALPSGTHAMVIADGRNVDGAVVARGCGEAGPLVGGAVNDIDIVLGQGITKIDGSYDVLMHMALGDALPAPYDETLELVTALLADPAGYAVYVTLRQIDREVGTTFVTRDGVEKSYREVEQETAEGTGSYPTWEFARNELDALLAQQLGQTYVDVTNVGAGVRDVATDFEVGARFALQETTPGTVAVAESWQAMVLYWPLPCADGDLSCARRPLTLEDAELAPVVTEYGGASAYAPSEEHGERFVITTDPHGLNVRYGAFLLAILEQVVFPSLPPGVAGDSFGDVLSNLVGCENIAQSLSSDPFAQLFAETFCETALGVAAAEVEGLLLDLEIGAVNPALGDEGLAASGSFALIDADEDLTTELVDEYFYDVAWNDPSDPAATADISAPIRGDGVRVRVACTDDAGCSAVDDGFTCQPRPSYLKIAAVDYGCARDKGALPGGTACVGDADCASGLCAPVGAGGALQCFRACDALNDCGAGQICSQSGGALDLDEVLDGLGDVELQGCAAP